LSEFLSHLAVHRLCLSLSRSDFFQGESSESLEAALFAGQKIALSGDLFDALLRVNHGLNFIGVDNGVQVLHHQALWKVFARISALQAFDGGF